jgi:hypothetical protein
MDTLIILSSIFSLFLSFLSAEPLSFGADVEPFDQGVEFARVNLFTRARRGPGKGSFLQPLGAQP